MINPLLAGYRKEGKAFFVHGNRGRKPATTIPDEIRSSIVALYRTKYYDANFRHFSELLESVYILSPLEELYKRTMIKHGLYPRSRSA